MTEDQKKMMLKTRQSWEYGMEKSAVMKQTKCDMCPTNARAT